MLKIILKINYKKHNTIKLLFGIIPHVAQYAFFQAVEVDVFLTIKNLTQESNFVVLPEPGDVILVNCGFIIAEDITIHGGI